MRKLKTNERLLKEYKNFILIEVACPNGYSYRTTIDKFEPKDTAIVERENTSTYESLGWYR